MNTFYYSVQLIRELYVPVEAETEGQARARLDRMPVAEILKLSETDPGEYVGDTFYVDEEGIE